MLKYSYFAILKESLKDKLKMKSLASFGFFIFVLNYTQIIFFNTL